MRVIRQSLVNFSKFKKKNRKKESKPGKLKQNAKKTAKIFRKNPKGLNKT